MKLFMLHLFGELLGNLLMLLARGLMCLSGSADYIQSELNGG